MSRRFESIQELLDFTAGYAKKTFDEVLDPLAERFAFHRAPATGEHRGDPMVLILGNHSSGKSTFINHILGMEVQRTGLAPIDDGFTMLTFGETDEKDGPAVVNNPDLPFADLEKFGPRLISHLKLKRRPRDFLNGLCLVDTPGMIDASDAQLNRGYDFISTVRWYVERSDVVLMFFDPDKPGTTGETLKVFTSALLDIDHKLLIVMNKMDQFRTLRDFARAYGALCWNLSKVIPRKDLPMIYTTYVPTEGSPKPALPLKDFQEARQEVIGEIRRAPARRIDNILTRMYDHSRKLRMAARVSSAAVRRVRGVRYQFLGIGVVALVLGLLVMALTFHFQAKWYIPLSAGLGGILASVGLYAFGTWQSRRTGREILKGMSGVFESVYHNEMTLTGGADDLKAMWQSIHDRVVLGLETLGFDAIKPLKAAEERRLEEIISQEGPKVRSEIHEAIKVLAAEGKYEGPMPHLPLEEDHDGYRDDGEMISMDEMVDLDEPESSAGGEASDSEPDDLCRDGAAPEEPEAPADTPADEQDGEPPSDDEEK